MLKGPRPNRVASATLTEYVTPADRLASSSLGESPSTVMFVNTFDALWESYPRIITWKFFNRPLIVLLGGICHLRKTAVVFRRTASMLMGAALGTKRRNGKFNLGNK